MPIKNSYVEASELIRRKRLTTIYAANTAADPLKFRALNAFSSYDPAVRAAANARPSGEVCNDECRTGEKTHNTFAATQFAGTKVAHFNR